MIDPDGSVARQWDLVLVLAVVVLDQNGRPLVALAEVPLQRWPP